MLNRIKMLLVPTSLLLCSPFDPETFMSQAAEGQLDTQVKLPPEADYRAMIDDFDASAFRTFTSEKNGKDYTVFSPPFVIQDDALAAELDREKVVVYHKGLFIDIDPTTGGFDTRKGKNVDLGKLRDCVGQNTGAPWSFNNLKGAGPVMVHVVHEADKNDPEKKYARVSRVVKIG